MSSGRNNSKARSNADATSFPIGGGATVTLPALVKGTDSRALFEKLSKPFDIGGAAVSLPRQAARAIADAVVEPADVQQIIRDKKFEHQDTPSGRILVVLRTTVWTSAVSSDGANGRSRLTIATGKDKANGPWPLPVSGSGPVLRYRASSLDRLANAVVASAKQILTAEMVGRLRQNPRGVWNPPTLVAAEFILPDVNVSLLHAAEGSTRIVGAQHLSGTPFDGPVRHADHMREFIHDERARIASSLVSMPESNDAQQSAKLATIPARIVVAVLEPDGSVSDAPFPDVIAEFIESVHVEPRGWDAPQQGNVVGERLVQALHRSGAFTDIESADILQRDHFHRASMSPDRIAATFIRAVTDPKNTAAVRNVILDGVGKRLSTQRLSIAVGPIILRAFRNTAGLRDTAEAALSREHLPDELFTPSWKVTHRSVNELLRDAEANLSGDGNAAWSDASRELVARGVGAMTGLGLVLSDQGQAVDNVPELRGAVSKVMAGLAMSRGGLRTIAEAINRANGTATFYPVKRKPDGSEVTISTRTGEEKVRYDPELRQTNIDVRALALTDGNPPKPPSRKKVGKTAEERFLELQKNLMEHIALALRCAELLRMLTVDGADTPLLSVRKLDSDLVGPARVRLIDLRDFVVNNIGDEFTESDSFSGSDGDLHDQEQILLTDA